MATRTDKSKVKKSTTVKAATPSSTRTKTAKPGVSKANKPVRDGIFVSYSHADKDWLERLLVHLKPLEREHKVNPWNDTKLRSGDRWKTEIDRALAKAKVAIMLVSADFLASEFIHNAELPPLLSAAEKEGLTILPVIVGYCGFTHSSLSQYQAVNNPDQPLNLLTSGQADQVFHQLSNRVRGIFVPASIPATPKTRKVKSAPIKKEASPAASAKTVKSATPKAKVARAKKTAVHRIDPAGNSALLVLKTGQWEIVKIKEAKQSNQLELSINQPNAQQRVFLVALRQSSDLSSVVYRSQLHLCSLADIFTDNVGSQETWRLVLTIQKTNPRAEISYGSMSLTMQAEASARLLLLDTPLPNQSGMFYGGFSSNTSAKFERSPLPTVYRLYNGKAAPFKIAAILICTWYLQINNVVEHILLLSLTMKGDSVTVHFEGKRSNQYQNDDQQFIEIEGTCDLSKSVSNNPLRLISDSRYR